MVRIAFVIGIALLLPGAVLADSGYFLGTRTGWGLTEQVFGKGRYKEHNLFIVIGAEPTTAALHTISGWKSKTTYFQDLGEGVDTFGEQLSKSGRSVPNNFLAAGKSLGDLFADPAREIGNFNLISPATIVFKTAVNAVKIGWHSAMLVAEPVARAGYGTVALVGAPFVKPATYAGVALAYSGTALYGYGSSAVAGTVMTAATGGVLALDVATSPAVMMYGAMPPDAPLDTETSPEDAGDDAPAEDDVAESEAAQAPL